jgi:fumarate hydratase subunit beta
MAQTHKATPPFTSEDVARFNAGDIVLLTGTIYTARDAAHKRIVGLLDNGEAPPFELKGSVIYYVGPTPAKPGYVIGSAGPTTSYRMDPYTPRMLECGVKMLIGKGSRNAEVREALKLRQGVYCAAIGGAAALLAERITGCEVIAFPELGAEAVRKLTVSDFPVIVVNDIAGNDLNEQGVKQYRSI